MSTALVIAAHGTRLGAGVEQCQQLLHLVRGLLQGTTVELGYVELVEPPIRELVQTLASSHDQVVVVPLMLGTGAHVQRDIPEQATLGSLASDSRVVITPHLGPHPLLLDVLCQRIGQSLLGPTDWHQDEVAVVLAGRGSTIAQANADHCALARLVLESNAFQDVIPCFVQVTGPDVAAALDRAMAQGSRRLVVLPNLLFEGRVNGFLHEQISAWQHANPEVEVRIAGVIGPCGELACVIAERYRNAIRGIDKTDLDHRTMPTDEPDVGSPVYMAGLDLRGRRVLVVGGGRVATRRLPMLLASGARVEVVAPLPSQTVIDLAAEKQLVLHQREAHPSDVFGAWYVLVATNDPGTNQAISSSCDAQHVFCVRADHAPSGTAWTPATQRVGEFTVGVVGNRDPRGSVRVRTLITDALEQAIAQEGFGTDPTNHRRAQCSTTT